MCHSRQFVLAASFWLCVKTCTVANRVAVASADNATEPPPVGHMVDGGLIHGTAMNAEAETT